jgi:transcriptional regulator with XRE-family HTH domain
MYTKIRFGDLSMNNAVQVKRTIESVKEFPGLGQKIKEARERDERTLTQICRQCGLSRSYWYQLEAEDLRSAATEDVIRKIEAVLGVDLGVSFEVENAN